MAQPGWYEDPTSSLQLRYFDGDQWTEQTQPKEMPPPADSDIPLQPPALTGDSMSTSTPSSFENAIPLPASTSSPDPNLSSHEPTLASWWQRVAASLIDCGIIMVLAMGAGVMLFFFMLFFGEASQSFLTLLMYLGSWALAIVLLSRKSQNGKTWGKQVMNIRVVRDDGEPMDTQSSGLREIIWKGTLFIALASVAGLPIIVVLFAVYSIVDSLFPLFNSENRAIHDILAKTHVYQD